MFGSVSVKVCLRKENDPCFKNNFNFLDIFNTTHQVCTQPTLTVPSILQTKNYTACYALYNVLCQHDTRPVHPLDT